MPGDFREDIEAAAAERRNLRGNNLFENLGEAIQKLLLEVQNQGKDVDDGTLELLSHVKVKQLAKIFEMLDQGEDPETILAWLKRKARKNKQDTNECQERKKMIKTGAERDPIAYYKEIEAQNEKLAEEARQMEEERAQLRLAKAKRREKQRAEKQKEAEEAEGERLWSDCWCLIPDVEKNAINNAFEKFANKQSDFDNTDKDQDGEWWKRDPYRRDWERNKGKGKKWTAVMEGSKQRATDPELAVREEFYKSNDWWKADKYKKDWEATKDAEWWKEEPYIKDWQANKHEGLRWKAADEESGLESEGNKYPATPEEQKRREEWYKANGPRGVVKRWNAATEGDMEKCSVPEKLDREEFYRNGDWWKNDDARMDFKNKGLDCDALKNAGKPTDPEWWKQEPYREDFFKNGPKGKKWTALNEDAGVDGKGDEKPAPEAEKKAREQWYKDNWWKADKYKDDWKKNGKEGKGWRAPTQKEAEAGKYAKPIGKEEEKKRDEWYRNPDTEWWKAPEYIEDFFQHGPEGRHWPAKTEADALGGKGQEKPAVPEEQKKREDWYRQNWWKQPKYTNDFFKNGDLGLAWSAKNDDPNVDKEWWKQPPFIENWSKTMKPKTKPDNMDWWKQPEYIEDFQRNGPAGKKWTAAKEGDGVAGKGHLNPASDPEKKEREKWYGDNWWKAPRFSHDWAKKGPRGDEWKAGNLDAALDPKKGAKKEPCSPEEEKEREKWYRPVGDMWRACGEDQGFARQANENPCPPADALKRDEWYRQNWWKAPEYVEDWKKNGPAGKKWKAATEKAGKEGTGDSDPATPEEQQKRDDWYKNAGDNEWWKEPKYCEDWARSGPKGRMWTADTRPNANKYGGEEHPATPAEKEQREQWYKDNWWKTPACRDDWKKNGPEGCTWTRKEPQAADKADPETEGDGWWKRPEYIEDWLKNEGDGKHWTAEDPVAAALGQGHKKPASDPEKDKREKWYKDNWWKAPSCADDWAKAGDKGKEWTAATPEATKAEEGDSNPASPEEKQKREDWYRKHGDADEWWKKPEFIEDFQDAGQNGKKWTAGNPTAGALGQGHQVPAPSPEKKKREDWYKDNWWKSPKYARDWAKGPEGKGEWKRDATPEEEKKRDAWYRENVGEPASDPEKQKRDDWYRKHLGEPSPLQLGKREDWYRKQLSDDDKAKRMNWLKDNDDKDKRILVDELPDALAAINEGQEPTPQQVQAVKDRIEWNRKARRDDFGDPDDDAWRKRPEDEDETIGRDEFLQAVADTDFYVPPDKDEVEMQEEEELADQEGEERARQEEEAAFLAMEAEEEIKNTPEQWQRKYQDPDAEEWWKRPDMIEAYQRDPEDPDAPCFMEEDGGSKPCDDDEKAKREGWYKDNFWKAPKYSQQWRRDGEAGDGWKKATQPEEDDDGMARDDDETPEVSPEELKEREKWYRNAKNPERQFQEDDHWWKRPEYIEDFQEGGDKCMRDADEDEKKEREKWFKDNWWKAPKHMDEWKKKAEAPEPEKQSWMRAAAMPEEDDDGMARDDKEEPPQITPEQAAERDAWYRKATEPFVGEKVPEQKPFSGEKFVDPFVGEKFVNEDDLEEDPAWEGSNATQEGAMVNEDPCSIQQGMQDGMELCYDYGEVPWDEELDDDDEGSALSDDDDDGEEDNKHQDDDNIELLLCAPLEIEMEWEEDEEVEEWEDQEDDAHYDHEGYEKDSDVEEEMPPEPWMLPLPEVTNNIYLKSYFPVLKWNPNKAFGAADRRIWVVDHFSKSFYCLDAKGKLKKQHDANKLLQLERNIMDPKRARLMFFDAPKSYEIVFPNVEERERFYETGSSIRPAIRVYAPSLTKPDTAVDGATTTTTIDGIKENAVVQKVPNPLKKSGELVDRELSGRCKINSSKVQDEPVSVWCGTFNMCGAPPPRDSSTLETWLPKGKYDICAVGVQECSYEKEEGEWFKYVQEYMGKDYLTLANMTLWDIRLIVLCKKKNLLKITNVEGSTKATLHKEKCGMKGATGICLRFHNTSMAFVCCHLAARMERTKMRNINVEEIVNQIQLANKDVDLSSQFHHVFWFGDMNYRIEMEHAEADQLIKNKDYLKLQNQDQLTNQMLENGILYGFKEAPITFAPTYRIKKGSADYMRDRGRAPSYTDRVLVKSMRNTTIKCTGYGMSDKVHTSEHFPVYATYVVRCLRPHMACFHRDQEPRPQFEFSEITFTEQTHLMYKKPMVMAYTQFSDHPMKGAVMKESTMTPSFKGEHIFPPIKSVTQMTEYLERMYITLIFRDVAEVREDKMFRGAAVMELDGRVVYDEERTEELEVLCLGRRVGKVNVTYKVTNMGYTPPPGGAPGRVPQEALMDERTDDVDEE